MYYLVIPCGWMMANFRMELDVNMRDVQFHCLQAVNLRTTAPPRLLPQVSSELVNLFSCHFYICG